jgi:DNA mismatch repair ATPase MutS
VDLLTDGEHGIRALQMAVTLPSDTNDLVIPLFQLQKGLSTTSAGLACAKISGVKASVIARAHEIVAAMRQGRTIQPLDEILLRELDMKEDTKNMLHKVITMDWAQATREDVIKLREAILRV